MIPVKLTIAGLYSYQQKQNIDFTKLTAANLFGIFGSVGSGKSSILEAITFAIYGKTDRLNLSGDNRNYNMMNLKSNELLIDFEFETGKDQVPYRATVKGRRNSKRFDDVKALDRSTYRYDGENWIPIEPTVLEEAIGLSYENFKRTVIIPQGQFQEFLQLGNKDRTKMMKELFNLEKFELFYKVTSLESKNNAQKQNIEGQLTQLGEIDPENIKAYEQQLVHLNKELDELGKKLNAGQKQEVQWQQILDLTKKTETAKNELAVLQKQEPDFLLLEKKVQQYEKCVLDFKNSLDLLEISTKKVALKTAQIEQDSIILKKEEDEIKEKEKALAEIQKVYDNREKLKQQAEELDKLSLIKANETEIENENIRLKKGAEIVKQTTEKAEKLRAGKEVLAKQIKDDKLKVPDLARLTKVKTWYTEKLNLDKKINEINAEIVKLENEQLQISKTFSAILEEESTKDVTHAEAVDFLQKKIESTKLKIEQIEKDQDHLRVKAQLEKYAKELKDGSPCPLCGSAHHPEIYNADDVHEEQNRLLNTKKVHTKEIETLAETISKIKVLEQQVASNTKFLNDWKKKAALNNTELEKHKYDTLWPKFEDFKTVDLAIESATLLQQQISKKEDDVENIARQFDQATKDKEKYQLALDKIKTNVTVLNTHTKTLYGQLKMISIDDYQQKSKDEIKNEQEALLVRYAEIDKQFTVLNQKLIELRKQKDTLSGSLAANKKELEQEKQNNKTLQEKINQQLEKSGYNHLDQVKQVLAFSIDIEKQEASIAEFKQKQTQSKTRLADLQKEMGNRVYDIEAHQTLVEEIKTINAEISGKKEKSGEIKTLLSKLQKDLESRLKLKKSLDELELRAENLKTLKSLFKASGFVNYISSVYLQNLCNAANERFFHLTRQKLSLEISEDNNFRVRDFMNGGKIRSVKTLSGGQTFQAALSLALALADNIQKITESNQNFFFLDEGFGSLDKEALGVVFDTLKALRKEDRIVGVISHVEEMQQEIDVHLHVENSEETGSKILQSWSN
ncbi:SMC family ATPase [Prolixibacteraceae bacterium Z1-6]|uniref:SMC family ATPase n=1 Tax=Draconibacterium aestuarii TaxID=2998507 RepID=A0A9X3JA17_9BACT|nr:SMC family ATPase [Prolixibacteraceae bacterium Z1-6]